VLLSAGGRARTPHAVMPVGVTRATTQTLAATQLCCAV